MKLQLINKIRDDPYTISFILKPDWDLKFKPGQFLRYHIANPSPDKRGENRFFSIASAPFEKVVRLTTKFTPVNGSTFKKDLQKMGIGEPIEAFGPSGSFTINQPDKNYVFIAGGIGITPFRSILIDLDYKKKPINVTLLYANRTKHALFKDELEILAKKHPEFKVYFIISEEPIQNQQTSKNVKIIPGKINETVIKSLLSKKGRTIVNLKSLPPKEGRIIFYISGPVPMVQSLTEMLEKMGIQKENIKRDEFPGYEEY